MSILSEAEMKRLESKYSEGIASDAVVKLFQGKGLRFSEATLRKYVQLGLLPVSRRVGIKGKHRGSSGVYPAAIVRGVVSIKAALDAGESLEALARGPIGLHSDLHGVRRGLDHLFTRLTAVVQGQRGVGKGRLKQDLSQLQRKMARQTKDLSEFIDALGTARKK
jgi:hypothetical protein